MVNLNRLVFDDVDDLILNLAGVLVTWLVLWPLSRHINNLLRRNRYDS